MLIPALRRFAQFLVVIGGGTAILSGLFGLLIGASVLRSIAVGFYLIGSFLLLIGFLLGNRGPVRSRGDEAAGDIFFGLGSRRLRWATREEQEEAINTSAVFVPIGLVLILVGIAADSRHALF
jgi:hypothetical protein